MIFEIYLIKNKPLIFPTLIRQSVPFIVELMPRKRYCCDSYKKESNCHDEIIYAIYPCISEVCFQSNSFERLFRA